MFTDQGRMRKAPGPKGRERGAQKEKDLGRFEEVGQGSRLAPGGLINRGIKNTGIQTRSLLPGSAIWQLNPRLSWKTQTCGCRASLGCVCRRVESRLGAGGHTQPSGGGKSKRDRPRDLRDATWEQGRFPV